MSKWSLHRNVLFRLLTGVACAGLLSSCLDEIKLEIPAAENASIAIRGRLVKNELPMISVQVTTLSSFNGSSFPEPVSGASVVLIDELNQGVDIPERRAGSYELALTPGTSNISVNAGQSYRLSVSTPDGRNYLSAAETLHAVPEPRDIRQTFTSRNVLNEFDNIERQSFVRFFLTTPTRTSPGEEPVYFKWDFLGTYRFLESTLPGTGTGTAKTCYIFEQLNRENPLVFNGAESPEELLRDLFILEEPFDFRFSDGFYLTVTQQSLSEGAYRYWEQISAVVRSSGNFFETPPGKVAGNFRNVDDQADEAFGYFYATEEKLIRYFVDLGVNRAEPRCPLTAPGPESVDTTCTNCLLRAGSTLIKPDFWEE